MAVHPDTPDGRLAPFFSDDWNLGDLVVFHTRHKLELFSHDLEGYRQLGRLVGRGRSMSTSVLGTRYAQLFVRTMAVAPTRGRHVDTLSHALGHLRDRVDSDERRQVRALIESYRQGDEALESVRSALLTCARAGSVSYLTTQTYLTPRNGTGPN